MYKKSQKMLLNLTQRVSISLQNLSQLRVVSCSSDILKRTSFGNSK